MLDLDLIEIGIIPEVFYLTELGYASAENGYPIEIETNKGDSNKSNFKRI